MFYDRSSGTWVARFPLGTRNGRRLGKKVTAPSERLAVAELENLRRIYGTGSEPATMTLDAYLADWLAGVRGSVAPATYVSYSGHVRLHIAPLLGGLPVIRIGPPDVRRLITALGSAGLAANTVRRVLTTLAMALGRAVREGSIPTNPALGQRLPRVERTSIRAMTFDDADAIMAAVREDEYGPLYTLLLYSGMRAGEAVGLDWRDVDLEGGTVFVQRGKTRSSARVVPLASMALLALKAHRLRSPGGPSEPVFRGLRKGQRLRVDVVTHRFPRLLEAAGLPRMRVHDLRHGTATLLLARGVPMRDIADLLGHASPSITMNVYAHVTEEMRRKAVQSLNRRPREGAG